MKCLGRKARHLTGTLTNEATYAGARAEWTGECVGSDCNLVRGSAGISADPCTMVIDSYQINLIPPVDVLEYGDYRQDEFTWSEDGCNLTDKLDLTGFPEDTGTLTPLFDEGHYIGVEGFDINDGVTYTCALDAHNSLNWTCDSEVLHKSRLPGRCLVRSRSAPGLMPGLLVRQGRPRSRSSRRLLQPLLLLLALPLQLPLPRPRATL